jgi:hypothetical protein
VQKRRLTDVRIGVRQVFLGAGESTIVKAQSPTDLEETGDVVELPTTEVVGALAHPWTLPVLFAVAGKEVVELVAGEVIALGAVLVAEVETAGTDLAVLVGESALAQAAVAAHVLRGKVLAPVDSSPAIHEALPHLRIVRAGGTEIAATAAA